MSSKPTKSPKAKTKSAIATPSRCPKCQSTDRSKYHNVKELPFAGETPDGQPYNTVVWRRTKCTGCNQIRMDRSYEMRSVAKPKTKTPQSGQLAKRDATPTKQASPADSTPTAKKPSPKRSAKTSDLKTS